MAIPVPWDKPLPLSDPYYDDYFDNVVVPPGFYGPVRPSRPSRVIGVPRNSHPIVNPLHFASKASAADAVSHIRSQRRRGPDGNLLGDVSRISTGLDVIVPRGFARHDYVANYTPAGIAKQAAARKAIPYDQRPLPGLSSLSFKPAFKKVITSWVPPDLTEDYVASTPKKWSWLQDQGFTLRKGSREGPVPRAVPGFDPWLARDIHWNFWEQKANLAGPRYDGSMNASQARSALRRSDIFSRQRPSGFL